jgi:carbamoyltransferase
MSKILSIHLGHDSNVTFLNSENEQCIILELERFYEERYYKFSHKQEEFDLALDQILDLLKTRGVENDFDILVVSKDCPELKFPKVNYKRIEYCDHHLGHAIGAYCLSDFDNCHVLSYDGSGNDGCFNYYKFSDTKFEIIKKLDTNIGWGYQALAKYVIDVSSKTKNDLALAGKLMGFSGYGESISPVKKIMKKFMEKYFIDHDDDLYTDFFNKIGIPNHVLVLHNAMGACFAATIQEASEELVLEFFNKEGVPENLCLTGGCALNILVNQKLRDLGYNLFIPPNPSDCGLSLGYALYGRWLLTGKFSKLDPITYSGLWIQDLDNLEKIKTKRENSTVNLSNLAGRLKSGEIIGVCRGGSEVGPRALGNRSILCDPVFPEMKDILNRKIKKREWYRPFAGVCRLEDAHKFFEIDKNQECDFMVYCPKVRDEYKGALKSITHIDGTCRLQTVTREQNQFIYDLLSQEGLSETPVLLNTSFNINGKPILSKAETALEILDETEIDAVVIEDTIFESND